MRTLRALALLVAASAQPLFLQSASEIGTKDELQTWLSTQETEIKAHIPTERQDFALSAMQTEYQQRLAELASEEPSAQTAPSFLFLESPRNCSSIADLDAWKERQETQVKGSVPFSYQPVALESIQQEYAKRAAMIGQTEVSLSLRGLPVLNLNAEEFQTEAQLDEWKVKQTSQINEYVPADYRHIASKNVEKEYELRLAALTPEVDPAEFIAHAKGRIAGVPVGTPLMWMASLALPAVFAVASLVAALRRDSGDGDEPLLERVEA